MTSANRAAWRGATENLHVTERITRVDEDTLVVAFSAGRAHPLIVRAAKEFCRPKPACEDCPLNTVSYSLRERCAPIHAAFR